MDVDTDMIVDLNENGGTNKSSLTDADLLRIGQFISLEKNKVARCSLTNQFRAH